MKFDLALPAVRRCRGISEDESTNFASFPDTHQLGLRKHASSSKRQCGWPDGTGCNHMEEATCP